MKTGRTLFPHLILVISAACIFFLPPPPAQGEPFLPFTSPALISRPDYPDRFTAPFVEPDGPSLKTPFFLSGDGYLYSVDSRGGRIYTVPLSYGLPVMPVMVPYFFVPLIQELP